MLLKNFTIVKYLTIIVFAFTSLIGNAQINVLNIESEGKDSNEIFINGISTKQDIGGVDFQEIRGTFIDNYGQRMENTILFLRLTNYNESTVTVLFRCTAPHCFYDKIFTVVLPASSKGNFPYKDIRIQQQNFVPREIINLVSITRKLNHN